MNTELWPIHPLTGSNKHDKSAIGKQISDLVKLTLVWNFRSGSTLRRKKLNDTGPEQGKVKHGMGLLKDLNKSPLVTLSQKGSENTIASM